MQETVTCRPLGFKNGIHCISQLLIRQKLLNHHHPARERERSETAAVGHANPGYHYGQKTGIQAGTGVS